MTNTAQETQTQSGPSISEIKAKMKATWEDGDYANFAKYMQDGAIEIMHDWGITPNQHILDIGCGSGQSAIPAAQQGHKVVGIDIAENLIEYATESANYEGLDIQFDVGDAEELPYADNRFDVVISMIGAMFAPRPDKVVTEMARVLRPGGKLCMANWTPSSLPAQMFKCVAGIMPPPPGFIPPVLWGDEKTVKERLSPFFSDIKLTRKSYPQWEYPFSIDEVVELFRTHFGPIKRAFDKLEADNTDQTPFRQELHEIFENSCKSLKQGATFVHGGEYLEVIATRHTNS